MISLTSPIKTKAHAWPAGPKLAGLCVITFGLFFIEDVYLHVLFLTAVLGLYALPGRVFLNAGLRLLRLLWPFILIVAIWHIMIAEFAEGATVILRLMTAVALANLVTMTTRLSDMTDVVKWLAKPLEVFGLRSNVLEMAIALVIRMTPVLIQKGGMLTDAWRARSRRRVGWKIVLPFTILAIDDAEQVSEALRARGGFDIK
jgi:biotin transport system permease protein